MFHVAKKRGMHHVCTMHNEKSLKRVARNFQKNSLKTQYGMKDNLMRHTGEESRKMEESKKITTIGESIMPGLFRTVHICYYATTAISMLKYVHL